MDDSPDPCPHCGFPLPTPLSGESEFCPRCGPPASQPSRKSWIIFLLLLLTPLGLNLVTIAFAKVKPPYGNGSGSIMFLLLSLTAIPVSSLYCGWFLAVIASRRPLVRVLSTIGLALVIGGFQLSLVWAGCALLMR